MTNEMQAYLDAVEKCLEQCAAMRDLELEKRNAIIHGDGEKLEHIIAQEQADMMRLDSLEKSRLMLQDHAGFGDMSSTEILNALPQGEDKRIAEPLIRELRATVEELQKMNREAMELAKQQLLIFGGAAAVEKAGENSPTYKPGQTAKQEWAPRRSFEEKI